MRLPISWLKDYLDLDAPPAAGPQELADRLTAIGHMEDAPAERVGEDTVLSLEVRQNRPDCLSIVGLARELAAVYNQPIKLPKLARLPKSSSGAPIAIAIENPELAYRFNALVIGNIKIGPSPDWLRHRLEASGIKSINNLVDITNYVMLEFGQPLHAFDLEKIRGGKLIVRAARSGEKLVVLGGKTIDLTTEDLIIADAEGVLALAGIIGGEGSGVSETTTQIVLEAATYNQASIRRTARRHNIHTEASVRLEKFLHPALTEIALARTAQLIEELCSGKITGRNDNYPTPQGTATVSLPLPEIKRLTGLEIDKSRAKAILERLELKVIKDKPGELTVEIPYFRTDLEQAVDLVEEVARIAGYDQIPERLPANPPAADISAPVLTVEEQAPDILTALGYDEQITDSLTNETDPPRDPIRLENSLSREQSMLRTQMEPSLTRGLAIYRKHKRAAVKLFEIGKIYFMENGTPKEERQIAVIASEPELTYRRVKGDAEMLLERLGCPGTISEIDLQSMAGEFPTFFFAIATERLMTKPAINPTRILTTIPQTILEDLSLVVPEPTPVGAVIQTIINGNPLIRQVELGEVYEDAALKQAGQKVLFLKITYAAKDQTPLSNETVKPLREKIVARLGSEFGAHLRGEE